MVAQMGRAGGEATGQGGDDWGAVVDHLAGLLDGYEALHALDEEFDEDEQVLQTANIQVEVTKPKPQQAEAQASATTGADDWGAVVDHLAGLLDGYEALEGLLEEDGDGMEPAAEAPPEALPEAPPEANEAPQEVSAVPEAPAEPAEEEGPPDDVTEGPDEDMAEGAQEEATEMQLEPVEVEFDEVAEDAGDEVGDEVAEPGEVEDEHTLAQKAMDAMLAGDMDAYAAFNAKLEQLQASSVLEKLSPQAEAALYEVKRIEPSSEAEDMEVKMLDAAGQWLFTSSYFGSFKEAPVHANLHNALSSLGFESPTKVQQYLWPLILNGHDALAVAPSGSGKSLGFLLPAFELILKASGSASEGMLVPAERPFMLILSSTPASAEALLEKAEKLSEASGIGAQVACRTGAATAEAPALLVGIHILIATPSRLLELLGRKEVDCSGAKLLVIDDVDRMLDGGAEAQIRRLFQLLPAHIARQSVFTAATWPPSLRRLASHLRAASRVQVGGVDEVTGCRDALQVIVPCRKDARKRCLLTSLRRAGVDEASNGAAKGLVMCSSDKTCTEISDHLSKAGIACGLIRSTEDAEARDKAVAAFLSSEVKVLVASDAAIKGLELRGLPLLVSYDVPKALEAYLRRCARVGSIGHRGVVVTLATDPPQATLVDIVDLAQRLGRTIPAEVTSLAMKAVQRSLKLPPVRAAAPAPAPVVNLPQPVMPPPQLLGEAGAARSRSPPFRR